MLYAASSVAGLPNDNLPHPYLRKRFSVTVQPTPTKFVGEYSKIVSDEPIVLDFPYFSQFWSSKRPIRNVVENFCRKLRFFAPAKIGDGPPKNQQVH